MYLGRVVEHGLADRIFEAPRHPYTQALLSAVPLPDPARQRLRSPIILSGDLPSPLDPPAGCRFHTRCPIAIDTCAQVEPVLEDPAGGQHRARCHLVGPAGEPAHIPGADASALEPPDSTRPAAEPA
jgi:oligopeptide/dipeptide ABC transporter ATP-binding protein